MLHLLGIGHLVELVYKDDRGRHHTLRPRGRWLAWCPLGGKRGEYVVVRRAGAWRGRRLSSTVAAAHARFHGEPLSAVAAAEWQPPRAPRRLGLLVRISYHVPEDVPSNKDHGAEYVHRTGDFGAGRDRRADRYKPELLREGQHLYVRRRPGNRYTVDHWLRG